MSGVDTSTEAVELEAASLERLDGAPHVVANQIRALAAERDALLKLVNSIRKLAAREQFDTTMLMSNPPQNPAAYYIGDIIDRYRAQKPSHSCPPATAICPTLPPCP